LTFTQRTIDVPLATKTEAFSHSKPVSVGLRTIGQLLVESRKKSDLTQKQMAEKVGFPRKWLGRWERDRAIPDQAQWSKLATILALPVAIPDE
jgi:ribosome-binding protein aMBF1 (putative translation factor)